MSGYSLEAVPRRPRSGSEWAITALSSVALADALVVALAQSGVVDELPQPRWRAFDTMRVVRSSVAYPLGMPDGFLGALNHAANIALVAMRRRSRRRRAIDRLLGANVAGGALGALFYAYEMFFRVRRLCPYCLVAIGINLAIVPLAWRELSEGPARSWKPERRIAQ